jgi:hypothetical protein
MTDKLWFPRIPGYRDREKINSRDLGLAINLDALVDGLELLLSRRGLNRAKNHLRDELPVLGDIPLFGDGDVDYGVVVL